ncbi:unnamed protein product [Rhizoctonia solani]|uniref:Nephrocystin 3-like N-terminal domain-containing protein n=1 Tax=Rhizoctonia solani TaxID=456999 RepID=A0A8H2WEB7_9AGAM|nr:unnamed protein product [Rhizoctonia solani]
MPGFKNKDTGQSTREGVPGASSSTKSTKSGRSAHLAELFKKIGSSGEFGPVSTPWSVIKDIYESVERVSLVRQEYEQLQTEVEELIQFMSRLQNQKLPPALVSMIENTCNSIKQDLLTVEDKLNRDLTKRSIETIKDLDNITQLRSRIQNHIANLSLEVNCSISQTVTEIQETLPDRIVTKIQAAQRDCVHQLFIKLAPATAAMYDSGAGEQDGRGQCTPGTRVRVLNRLLAWARNSQNTSMLWVNGMAGTGKTTIAYSLCEELKSTGILTASFFCNRSRDDCKDAKRILPSIACQLAKFSHVYAYELYSILQDDWSLPTSNSKAQFKALVENPLRLPHVREALSKGAVVVIDALDECDDKFIVKQILGLFLSKGNDIPIKFIVLSRPDLEIEKEMKKIPNIQDACLDLHDQKKEEVQLDIQKYLKAALSNLEISNEKSHSGSLNSYIDKLAKKSGELFIYAATAVRFIHQYNPGQNPLLRFQNFLETSTADNSLDALYRGILDEAFSDNGLDNKFKEDMKLLLDTIICVQEPLTASQLGTLLRWRSPDKVCSTLEPLRSVIRITGPTKLVAVVHTSFSDFMVDRGRSKDHHCNMMSRHNDLAQICFECIDQIMPKFNICGLESSYQLDAEIPTLEDQVKNDITSQLFYACRNWSTHFSMSSQSRDLFESLEIFLSSNFLLWMEVLSLKKVISTGPTIIHRILDRCKDHSKRLSNLAHDAALFVTTFAANPVSQSTPHIYVSMLAFWPPSAPISKHYRQRMHGMIKMNGKVTRSARPVLLAQWPLSDEGRAAALSPNENSIVVAVGKSLQVFDLFTGREIPTPLEGHTGAINSVDFSPDGAYIASGSSDKTVRLWDVHSRQYIKSLIKHTESVYAVAFSPNKDTKLLASGSGDCLIYIWNITEDKPVYALSGHEGPVYSVKFSPSGSRVVSGSQDWTVRVWDINEKKQTIGPRKFTDLTHIPDKVSLKEPIAPDYRTYLHRMQKDFMFKNQKMHESRRSPASKLSWLIENAKTNNLSHAIFAVAFAPNLEDPHIISGCRDSTLRLWNSTNGGQICTLLDKNNSGSIMCVAFTPDGDHIISGNADGTVCIWNIKKRRVVLGPLMGHQGLVKWVGCSQDGARIFSVSIDQSIRVWDLHGEPSISPIPYSSAVKTLGFSRDGAKILSGSEDSSIHLWDAQSGQQLDKSFNLWYNAGPKRLSSNGATIYSATISPDGTQMVYASEDKMYLWNGEGQGGKQLYDSRLSYPVFSRDGTSIAASTGQTIHILDISSTRIRRPIPEDSLVTSISYSPDSLIAVGLDNGSIGIWSTEPGDPFRVKYLRGHESAITSTEFSSNGLLVSGSSDSIVRMWNVESGEETVDPIRGHTGPVHWVAFTFDNNHILSAAEGDGIYMWDVKTGAMLMGPLSWHTRSIKAVVASPNGIQIASGFNDGTIAMWNVQTYNAASEPEHRSPEVEPSTTWTMHNSGWIIDDKSKAALIWLPYDLRPFILPAKVTSANHLKYRIQLGFEGAYIGKLWFNCYQPEEGHPSTENAFWEWGKARLVDWYRSLTETLGM